jgi:hypothetical protein
VVGVVEELPLGGEGALEAGEHVVEGGGDPGRLVTAAYRYAPGEVGRRNRLRGVGERPEWSQNAPCQAETDQGGHHDRAELDERLRGHRAVDLRTFPGREVGDDQQAGGPAGQRQRRVACLARGRQERARLRLRQFQPVVDRVPELLRCSGGRCPLRPDQLVAEERHQQLALVGYLAGEVDVEDRARVVAERRPGARVQPGGEEVELLRLAL